MASDSTVFVGWDVGGQSTKLGFRWAGTRANPAHSTSVTTFHDPERFLLETARALVRLLEQHSVPLHAVAAGGLITPGPLDAALGLILDSANLSWPGWKRFPIRDLLATTYLRLTGFELPLLMDNDANGAGAGIVSEFDLGSEITSVLGLTLGTGIGGFVLRRGKNGKWQVHRGKHGAGAELGHVKVQNPFSPGVRKCGCGQLGCLEAYLGAEAFGEFVHEERSGFAGETQLSDALWNASGADRLRLVFEAAERGDALGMRLAGSYARHLAVGLSSMVHVEDQDVIFLAGGVTQSGPYLLRCVREMLGGLVLRDLQQHVRVEYAPARSSAGWIGATYLGEELFSAQ